MISLFYGYFMINILLFLLADYVVINSKDLTKEQKRLSLEWDFHKWQFFVFFLFFGAVLAIMAFIKRDKGGDNE